MIGAIAGGTIGALGSLGGALIGASGAKSAARIQADAAREAARLQAEAAAQGRLDVAGTIDPAKAELTGGIQSAIGSLAGGQIGQLQELEQARRLQSERLMSGRDDALSTFRGAQASGLERLAGGFGTARGDITAGYEGGIGRLDPYSEVGQQALQQEAALSGALGYQAQEEAMRGFQESPGQKYLRERQEQALLRSSAAIGGLGGGNVRTALQEQAMGIASTDQQRYLENLRNLAGRGQSAATQQAGMQTQGAQSLAQLAAQQGMSETDLIAQMQGNIAGSQMGTAQQLANLEGQYGANRAGIVGQTAADIANLNAMLGANRANITQGAGTTLANIAVGQGTQQANLAQDIGSARAAGTLGVAQAYGQGLAGIGQSIGGAFGQYRPPNYQRQVG